MPRAAVCILLKKGILDPQGKAVQAALAALGFDNVVEDVRVGKYVELRLKGAPTETLTENVSEMCVRLLANPVIETYRFEVLEEP